MREDKDIISYKYHFLRERYLKLAKKITVVLKEILETSGINFHNISYRAKDIDSFIRKAENPKYEDPLEQITDLAGIRIIGYVEDDVKKIGELIPELFDIDASNSLDKSAELGVDRVGYRSLHFVCQVKDSRAAMPEYVRFKNMKFEIQVRTILQHSWAEIEHDKNYKFLGELPNGIKRRFKLLAGNLETADREFNDLAKEIDKYSKDVKVQTENGNLKIELNSTSLNQFLMIKFKDAIDKDILIAGFNKKERQILDELRLFGIKNLGDLDSIIDRSIYNAIIGTHRKPLFTSFTGLLRTILIASDAKRYFEDAYSSHWTSFSAQSLEVLQVLGKSKERILFELQKANKRKGQQ